MPLSDKISNILGTEIPFWVMQQLDTRSKQNTQDVRDNDNLIYLANKSAWVRLVSSINLSKQSDFEYFKRIIGDDSLRNGEDLAKKFVLFGGTSKYLNTNSYGLRSGIGQDGAYGTLGNTEIQKYGYRPMPGITNVSIETQGKLGSVRAASINFKCWDKDQLDIIDALYFKLGFSMFLEWGHTFFYKADTNKVESSELYSIDPFKSGLNKEEIFYQIAENSRNSEGNYGGMLGIVSNFNFSYNQEGGYDCILKLISLGALGDSIKINNPGALPGLLKEEILNLNNTLLDIAKAEQDLIKAKADAEAKVVADAEAKKNQIKTAQSFIDTYIQYAKEKQRYVGGDILYPSDVPRDINYADFGINTPKYGQVLFIRRLKGFIPTSSDYLKDTTIVLDGSKFLTKVEKLDFATYTRGVNDTESGGKKTITKLNFSDERVWEYSENFTQTLKDFGLFAPIAAGVSAVVSIIDPKSDSSIPETVKADSTSELTVGYKGIAKKSNYNITIKRRNWAYNNEENIVDSYKYSIFSITDKNAYYYIDAPTFTQQLKNVLNNPNNLKVKSIDINYDTVKIVLYFTIPFTRTVKVYTDEEEGPNGTIIKATIKEKPVTYNLYCEITIEDTSLISSFSTSNVQEPIDFLQVEKKLSDQNQEETTTEEDQKKRTEALSAQIDSSLQYQSGLEIILRTIEVHSLSKAINNNGLDIKQSVYPYNLWDTNDKIGGKTFLEQIFSNGIFSSFISDLVKDDGIPDSVGDKLKLYTKYGFASSLMANSVKLEDLQGKKVDYKKLLTSYTVPYNISQEITKGISTNHPVYIPFGLLLMILNNICTIYDTKKDGQLQTPLLYIDFNPELNFCLSNNKQLSTDPWTALIPFQGTSEDYRSLFDPKILQPGDDYILPVSGSNDYTLLFDPKNEDALSGQLPLFKEDSPYRGKIMNILLNLDYLINLVKQFASKDSTNKVYLKPFLEQILSDLNKSLGNFNIFRLSYNDNGNTLQIVDDQLVPPQGNENLIPTDNTTSLIATTNTRTIPLLGKSSIAKSIEIKSEVSSKLSNMLAISANPDFKDKATLSTNGDSVGYINESYYDRYITNRQEVTSSKQDNLDTIIVSATKFNTAIKEFYSTTNPSSTNVSQATNYYIDKMTKIKNDDYATRASAMIPVSINFNTDGIGGLNMMQGFTIPEELLPYTYATRKIAGMPIDHLSKVGFVIIGLSHTLESNTWNTSVKANMIFLKEKSEFSGSVSKLSTTLRPFTNNGTGDSYSYTPQTNFIAVENDAKKSAETYLGHGLSAEEWTQLVAVTFAEASENQTERAYVMGVVLNRVKTNFGGYGTTVTAQITAKNQFESVTGKNTNNFRSGPNSLAATSIYGAAEKILPSVPKTYLFFTSANRSLFYDSNGNKIQGRDSSNFDNAVKNYKLIAGSYFG
jgi:hypothetical protein